MCATVPRVPLLTPEAALHLLSLCCGWPGALYAQQLLRHKTVKVSFRVGFWFTVVLNVGGLFYFIAVYRTRRKTQRVRPPP